MNIPEACFVFQKVTFLVTATDSQGNVAHTLTATAWDLNGLAAGVKDRQDTQYTPGLHKWVAPWINEGLTVSFSRRGDWRLTDRVEVIEKKGEAPRDYHWNDEKGYVSGIIRVDGVIKEQKPWHFEAIRFISKADYRYVWHDEVNTVFVNPSLGWDHYKFSGKLTFDTGVGGAEGAEGVDVFPEKASLDPSVTGGIDRNYANVWQYPDQGEDEE